LECDARLLPKELNGKFQKVLVDAECTNDGRQEKFWSKIEEVLTKKEAKCDDCFDKLL